MPKFEVGLHSISGQNLEQSENQKETSDLDFTSTEDGQWWAEIAIHADIEDNGSLEVAVYFEAERVCVGWLDEWGDWRVRIEGLRRPQREGLVSFEVVNRPVRLRAGTHIAVPMSRQQLINEVERGRG